MKTKTQLFSGLWQEARTRFSQQLNELKDSDMAKKLSPGPNSLGFLLRHIGDVEFLFAKNVFGAGDLKVSAKTLMAQKDTGEWTNREELIAYTNASFEALRTIIEQQKEEDWDMLITTKEFGEKTKSEALGRIVSHTAYHAGQLALIRKYGSS